MLRFQGAGVTDVGMVRDHNEDSAFMSPYLALVADGVGGAAAGEVASATAAYVVSAHVLANLESDLSRVVIDAVHGVRKSLQQGVVARPERAGMATTLTILACDGKDIVLGHIGDSRAYLFDGRRLTRISSDHTYVQTLVDAGQLAADAVRRHPWRNVVVRSLHADPEAGIEEIDLIHLGAHVGDRFLVCSDGLTDLIDEDRIATVLKIADPHSAAARLVEDALVAGGTDNVTCLVFDVIDGPRVVGDGMLLGAVRDVGNIVDPASVRIS
ncbi:PP2C family protein-serine/threonine phosphatase [Nocardioides sp.]|uniref:PP2C family protein-serine/threonine phosphatase n=1 Tax=Nocardioides sp. TaxID=35761 RepID=UPI003D14754F